MSPSKAPQVALLVPFRFGDDPARDRAWRFVRAWYQEAHPAFHLYVGTFALNLPWSKGHAVARAASRARRNNPVLYVVADADVIVDPAMLNRSIEAVAVQGGWSQPHAWVYRLARTTTSRVYTGELPGPVRRLPDRVLERRGHAAARGGGIVVLSAAAFDTVGGPDPRFIGWGGDDVSWARALDTLAGPCVRFDAPLWHLWHERMERRRGNRASDQSERLAGRYIDADRHPELMQQLVAEHRSLVFA